MRKETAYISESENSTYIVINNLAIEIDEDPQEDGPLGLEGMGGRNPGVIFWRHPLVREEEGDLKTSLGECIGHFNDAEMTISAIRKEVESDDV